MTANDGFATRLRRARIKRGWTQAQLAGHIGLPHTVVSRWERGTHQPQAKQTAALVAALGVSADYLLGRADDNGDSATFEIPTALREFLDTPLGQVAQQHQYVQALIDWKPPARMRITPRLYAGVVAALLAYENEEPSTK